VSDTCTAEIHHGPGHQSVSTCERTGEHRVHVIFERNASDKLWVDEQAMHQKYDSGREGFSVFTGIFDESPLEDEGDADEFTTKPTCPSCYQATVERQPDNRFLCSACGSFNEAKPYYERQETDVKLYARYFMPGMLMSEETTHEVESLADALAKAPSSAFCFETFRLPEVDFDYDRTRFKVTPLPQNKSDGKYYLGGAVYGVEEIRAGIHDLDPTGSLLSNMESNGWPQVIKCRTGNWQPFFIEKDVLLDPTDGKQVEVK